ncbi:Signal transduction histidine kinase [Variovorax sp. HW608]|uniref:ATP-binding response regulator n=1 Tax=Variovorax sp. HW608 TaxID=1034889 RepID=UPI00081F85F8|nr:hybrid sensor histidine kinase/response regulator [Variovorax sp. HW608]SCK26543.1 Signal transduction histidine kinase [Variovorax sp. HW608]
MFTSEEKQRTKLASGVRVISDASIGLSVRELQPLVEAEQVRLSVQQLRRLLLPLILADAFVTWVGWQVGLQAIALAWFAVMVVAHTARWFYLLRIGEPGRVEPATWLSRSAAALIGLAVLRSAMVLMIFTRPVGEYHYVLTMISFGSAVGAISPVAGHLRSYVGWMAIVGAALCIGWVTRGTLEGSAIATLLLLLFVVLTFYVRDQGRALVQLVSLSESLRRERDRAEKASEAKTRFFAAASHDLRQPLTALSYNAATVQELARLSGDEMLDRVGQGIRRALSESSSLLDSLLEVSKLDAGAVRAEEREVDVMKLLGRIAESFTPVANAAGLELRCLGGHHKGLWVRTDLALLRRIIQNLLGNAIKFTHEGHVSIEAFADDRTGKDCVCIRVSDTGPGIPDELQEHVFEEFYQVGNPERNRSRGLGLGLAIVRRIAGLLNINVTLTSQPGQGAVFELRMPRIPAPRGAGAQLLPDGTEAAPASTRKRVLFIDDEPEIRESLTTLLSTLGWEVRSASDQQEAEEIHEAGFSPDVLLIDFRLRDNASGLDAWRALKRRGCDAPGLMITGETEPRRIAAAREAGITVLYKPVDGAQLLQAMGQALGSAITS